MTSAHAPQVWHFDARRLGREIRSRREAAGYSTRQLARLAGMSQAYVVALERSTSSRDAAGPTPTVEVLVGLASALGLDPRDLLETSLRRAGPHVLYVVEGEGQGLFDTARGQFTDIDVWLSAGRRRDPAGAMPHIDTHPHDDVSYRTDGVTETIRRGFQHHGPLVRDQRVGVVFSDTDSTMLGARDELLAIEHEWQSIVAPAAWAVGAETTTAVCVYELDVLQRMASPLAASLDLIESHDTVWFSMTRGLSRGRDAGLRVLQRLRPAGVRAEEWRRTCVGQLERRTTTGVEGPPRAH